MKNQVYQHAQKRQKKLNNTITHLPHVCIFRIGRALLDLSISFSPTRDIVKRMTNDLTVGARDGGAAGSAGRLDAKAGAHVDDAGAAGVDT